MPKSPAPARRSAATTPTPAPTTATASTMPAHAGTGHRRALVRSAAATVAATAGIAPRRASSAARRKTRRNDRVRTSCTRPARSDDASSAASLWTLARTKASSTDGILPRGVSSTTAATARATRILSRTGSRTSSMVSAPAMMARRRARVEVGGERRGDHEQAEDESEVPSGDRAGAGPDGIGAGGLGDVADDRVDQPEAGAAHGQSGGGPSRAGRRQEREGDQAQGESQAAGEGTDPWRGDVAQRADHEHGDRQDAHDQRAGDRGVAPHLDHQEDAEEQRSHEAGGDEDERSVGAPGRQGALAFRPLAGGWGEYHRGRGCGFGRCRGRAAPGGRWHGSRRRGFSRRRRAGRARDEGGHGERCLGQEDRPPREQLGQDTAQGRADREAGGGGKAPCPAAACGAEMGLERCRVHRSGGAWRRPPGRCGRR